MEHKVIHFEIQGRDGKKTQEFYASLFGWKIDANNPMQYGIVAAEAPGIAGGICQAMGPPLVTFYVSAPDLAAALKKAERLGGLVGEHARDAEAGGGRIDRGLRRRHREPRADRHRARAALRREGPAPE